ncbi:hypothetical protein UT300003_13460 [Clostridium sardiniense]
MKYGTPIMEITIPTGISIGASKFLDIVSAISIIKAPNNADIGIKFLCLGPTNFLAI